MGCGCSRPPSTAVSLQSVGPLEEVRDAPAIYSPSCARRVVGELCRMGCAASIAANGAQHGQGPAPRSKYTDLDALLAFILRGDVQFVKASYFLALAAKGGIFPRRQDLPTEALASRADVKRWGEEIRATLKLRAKFKGDDEIQLGARFPPLVVDSYAWCATPSAPLVFTAQRSPALCRPQAVQGAPRPRRSAAQGGPRARHRVVHV